MKRLRNSERECRPLLIGLSPFLNPKVTIAKISRRIET
jgi:hypothetical protein